MMEAILLPLWESESKFDMKSGPLVLLQLQIRCRILTLTCRSVLPQGITFNLRDVYLLIGVRVRDVVCDVLSNNRHLLLITTEARFFLEA